MPKVVPEYKEQAKKRIIEAAAAEFGKRGYRKTTMSDIAQSIGVSKGAVYQYFDSKEDLVGAVGRSIAQAVVANEALAVNRLGLVGSIEEAMEGSLDSMPDWFPDLLCDFLSEAHRDKKARRQVMEIEDTIVTAISGFWEEWKREGKIPRDLDTVAVARGMVALQLGLITLVSNGLPRSSAVAAWGEMIKGLVDRLDSDD